MVLENKTRKPEREETSEASELEKALAWYREDILIGGGKIVSDLPTCPYCNWVHDDYHDYIDEEECELICEDCGKTFYVSGETSVTFESRKIPDPETPHEINQQALEIIKNELETE